MKKASLILVISASFIVGTLVAGNLVFAAPADSQNELLSAILQEVQALVGQSEQTQQEISFRPMGTTSGGVLIVGINHPDAILLYGDTFCGVRTTTGVRLLNNLYIEFVNPMTVMHESCNTFFEISLEGNTNADFQPGDVLVLVLPNDSGPYEEVYREQT